MIAVWLLLLCAVGMTVAQDLDPGAQLFHAGWYNALDAALLIAAFLQYRKARAQPQSVARGTILGLCGATLIVVAGIASGLMGPDTHTIAGAPGTTVRDDQAGVDLQFPPLHAPPAGRRYSGALILWQTPRTVVVVHAADAGGSGLTITQPANASFLSPVLLMQQRAKVAGLDVAVDGFALPALRRSVKAVLFAPEQAAHLPITVPAGSGAVLFEVSDQSGTPLPHAIGIVASGREIALGGVRLHPQIETYPAIVVASAPLLPALIAGGVLLLAGIVRVKNPFRWRS